MGFPKSPDVEISSDASFYGFGGGEGVVCNKTQGQSTVDQLLSVAY